MVDAYSAARWSLRCFEASEAMHPIWNELNTIVFTLRAMVATDRIEDRNEDETGSQRKTTRTPTPFRRDSQRYPSPTIANFDLRRRVNAGASYMLACSCRRPSLPAVCLLSRCPWSRKNGVAYGSCCESTQWHRVLLARGLYFGDRKRHGVLYWSLLSWLTPPPCQDAELVYLDPSRSIQAHAYPATTQPFLPVICRVPASIAQCESALTWCQTSVGSVFGMSACLPGVVIEA